MPSPQVNTSFSWGTNDLTIVCQVVVSSFVNTGITVNINWTRNNEPLLNDSRTTITPPYQSQDKSYYQSSYRLTDITQNDADSYGCSVNLLPESVYEFLSESENVVSSISIVVARKSSILGYLLPINIIVLLII